jgi:chromosome segregation ATPase
MVQEINNLMNDYNEVIFNFKIKLKNDFDHAEQETQIINGEIQNKKYNVEVLRNDIKAIKDELKIANEDINHIRHLIVKQKKENETLKKIIVKQVLKVQVSICIMFK